MPVLYKVFIDGGHGTTGLRIREYLEPRSDIQILEIDPDERKNMDARLSLIKEADVSVLCLPDQAAREIALAAPDDAVLIDTSSAHRVSPGWVYGMPELSAGQRGLIRSSTRIANPGCHASGFILLIRPLIDAGLLSKDSLLTCFCMTGYSGGGKSMIASYEADERPDALGSPGQYALSQSHKHLPEMVKMTGLSAAPCFSPVVGDFYSGMVMTVPLHKDWLSRKAGTEDVKKLLSERYKGEPLIKVKDELPESGFIYSNPMAGSNGMEIYVSGNDERMLLMASYDNLGKGASGAAVQNLNIVLGVEERMGLE
ncbi:MAG: N-acetyl-gamma-glutamyl-phosphate reductase [Mogibacterium sp.]|nr:N-acetyl-gamma-glutamyl-phosphate reductase [Mogibacterium sp.]